MMPSPLIAAGETILSDSSASMAEKMGKIDLAKWHPLLLEMLGQIVGAPKKRFLNIESYLTRPQCC